MSAPRPKLDIDRTRERLLAPGLHLCGRELWRAAHRGGQEADARCMTSSSSCSGSRLTGREGRRVKTSLRLSGLPTGQTLANFDFAFQPAIERSRIETLATCAWVRNAETVLIQGPPGVGKTHFAVGLGIKAVEQGFSVLYLASMSSDRTSARRATCAGAAAPAQVHLDGAADHRRTRVRADEPPGRESVLPPCDLPLRPRRVPDHDQQIVREWTELLAGDEVLATAMLDRLAAPGKRS